MIRLAAAFAVLVSLSACGGTEATAPTSPTPVSPSPTVFVISGRVFGNGTPIAGGATVTITEGIHAGQERDTDNGGSYRFDNLTPSTMTLRAAFSGYVSQSKSITLTNANLSVDFALSDH